jgi:hypothetical protein
MLSPAELDKIPNEITVLYSEFEMITLKDMAKRINRLNYLTDTTSFQAQQLKEMNLLYDATIEDIAILTNKSEKQVKKLFKDASLKSLAFDDKIYKQAGLKINDSPTMLEILKANILKTNGDLRNLTMTTANTMQQMFLSSTNLAHMQIVSGTSDYDTAIKNAIKTASKEGLEVLYPSGQRRTIESAVRTAVLTSVNQTTGKLQEERIKDLNVELVQTSQHTGARPSHAVWQGKIFKWEGSNDKYDNFESATGYGTVTGLMGANCKHSFYPFFKGISEKIAKEKESYVNYQGKKITEYEASQMQRYNERQIRKWKRQSETLKQEGFDNTKENVKVKEWQKRQREFLRETGLTRDYPREQIA